MIGKVDDVNRSNRVLLPSNTPFEISYKVLKSLMRSLPALYQYGSGPAVPADSQAVRRD
jgi:hypothetical protein